MTRPDRTDHLILEEMKKPSVPNIEQFAFSVVEVAESMANQSNELKKCAKRCLGKIKKVKSRGSVSRQEIAHLMEHDPGKRGEISSDNQREFLINMGPYQPKLATYPSNDSSIPPGKQNRFSTLSGQSMDSKWS